MEPAIELAANYGLTTRQVTEALALLRRHEDEIRNAWKRHFSR